MSAIEELAKAINNSLVKMVGSGHSTELTLGFSPTDPTDTDRLIRALRLFIDGGKRGIPLYTAVTRGKKLAVVVGTKKALGIAVRRQDTSRRYAALRKRLAEI